MSSEIEDRRQRAREAGLDATVGMWDGEDFNNGVERAVEVATRVKITDEAIEAYYLAARKPVGPRGRLHAFLTALGFEVVD